jgi:hypothetical protein
MEVLEEHSKQEARHLMEQVEAVPVVLVEIENQAQELVVLDLVIQYQDHHCSMQEAVVAVHTKALPAQADRVAAEMEQMETPEQMEQ